MQEELANMEIPIEDEDSGAYLTLRRVPLRGHSLMWPNIIVITAVYLPTIIREKFVCLSVPDF